MLKYKSCPKCGNQPSDLRGQWYRGPRYCRPDTIGKTDTINKDRLEYECARCGFSWFEPCLDTRKKGAAC